MYCNQKALFLAVLLCSATLPATAATSFFTDRTIFNSASGFLITEDFETANVADGSFEVINAPLDSTSSNAAFDPGDLLPGFQILDNPGPGTLIVLGAGTIPTATRSILANLLGDSMDVLFPSGVAEVGFDFWTTPTAGQITALVVTITVFDTNGNELGVVTPTSSASGATFFGVISDAERIGRVNLFSATPSAEVIDNLAFSAPEPGSWILLSSGLALLGLRRRRKS